MESLPPEMLLHVLRYVAKLPSCRELCRAECVSRTWRDVAKQNEAEIVSFYPVSLSARTRLRGVSVFRKVYR